MLCVCVWQQMNAVIKISSNVGRKFQIHILNGWPIVFQTMCLKSFNFKMPHIQQHVCWLRLGASATAPWSWKKNIPKTDHDLIDIDKSEAQGRREYSKIDRICGRCN